MSQSVNFQTTNPAQLTDRVTELQIAVQLDEANNLAVAAISHAEGSRTIQGGAARPEGLDSPLTVTHHQPGKL